MSQSHRHHTRLARVAPGLAALLQYRRDYLKDDLRAGLSVAAVALPVAVAYAELAGFHPVTGLYACILPMLVYALFGTSRQLVVGPDAATCALLAAAVAPLAAGDEALYLSLSLTLTFFTGLFCIAAGLMRLGALAEFLSRPILVGFLNGVALSILLGQLGKIAGFTQQASGIVPRLAEFFTRHADWHGPTLALSALSVLAMLLSKRYLAKLPAALIAMTLAAVATAVLGLGAQGVATIGLIPAGLPPLHVPSFSPQLLPTLLADAAGLALVSFSSMMLTAQSFAEKNRYSIDTDREFVALGLANMASSFSQGFAISGADSRTAVADSSGGRSQLTSVIAALAIALVLLFFTAPLAYVPVAALGVVLVFGALSLVNLRFLAQLYRISRGELALCLLATVGVVAVGAIQAILLVVVLALLRFVRSTSRPLVEELGRVEGMRGFHALQRHAAGERQPGILLLRFNAPLVFFNAQFFRRAVRQALDQAGPGLRWFVLDMLPVTDVDATGLLVLRELVEEMTARGVTPVMAGRRSEWQRWREARGIQALPQVLHFATLREAQRAFAAQNKRPGEVPGP
ncbi:SulP family inorganic anion transporter [Aquipseudomonas alcaligenes]|uniref:SulP family inorganic anion transporter n=1 Tax=Aquipseudomonas alcaligenes TaxID=43263 RepID=A0A2V4LE49_AQUAC|nr:SulP family inorganic anion transporter [Pseudomonas alcaligenes]PYC24503.1 SulP family inorganic anion transporter [Pseudomonas alcaligenes]